MINYKNRTIDFTKPVQVYRNLTKNTYSISQHGVVIAHSNEVSLQNCTFHCKLKTRAYSQNIGRKLVHSFVKGYLISNFEGSKKFNFSLNSTAGFVNENGEELKNCNYVKLSKTLNYE